MQLHRDDSHHHTRGDSHDRTHAPIDCVGMKAALSAYLDDELTRAERFEADSHLVGCGNCRALVERAETLDRTLRSALDADIAEIDEEFASNPMDLRAFRAGVLEAVGAEHRRRWMPRIAAVAAVLAAVAGATLFFRSGNTPASLAPLGPGEILRGGTPAPSTIARVAPPSEQSMQLASLSSDDRQALYATSVLLEAARRTAFDDRTRREELIATARYDELVDRLEGVLPKLPAEDRATVALARAATELLAEAADNPDRWARLQEDVTIRALDRSVDELSDRE
jgi:hypothetical protein